ncbi:MAG: glycolate oxidase subunit GlcE [Ottowia sp.]|nr:glycolate oxidase subunit GlcE [Ottowia sp.]
MAADTALQDLAQQVQAAFEQRQALRIRGSGSKDFYGQRLHGQVAETSGLSGIVQYEPSELVVTARAGTPLAELDALLAEHGQHLPFEPPHFNGQGTVGGAVATGLAGPARAGAGGVRDYVLGLQLLDGRGQLLNFGGQVMKNVAGYDVSRLMTGALGTLGIITQVSLKVMPLPPAECTLMFELSETSARQQLNRWGGQPLPLNASCWADGHLAVRLRGARAAIAAARRSMGGAELDPEKAARQWQALRDQKLPFFRLDPGLALWRISVPDTAAPLSLGTTMVEWHGALRWARLPLAAAQRVCDAARRAGGHATLFRGGDGHTPVFSALTPPQKRVHHELKRAFDPAGILNAGRLMPDF